MSTTRYDQSVHDEVIMMSKLRNQWAWYSRTKPSNHTVILMVLSMVKEAIHKGAMDQLKGDTSSELFQRLANLSANVTIESDSNSLESLFILFDRENLLTKRSLNQWQQRIIDLYGNHHELHRFRHFHPSKCAVSSVDTLMGDTAGKTVRRYRLSPLTLALLEAMDTNPLNTLMIDEVKDELNLVLLSLSAAESQWAHHYFGGTQCVETDRDHSALTGMQMPADNLTHILHHEVAALLSSGEMHPVEALLMLRNSSDQPFGEVVAQLRDMPPAVITRAVRTLLWLALKEGQWDLDERELVHLVSTADIDDLPVSLLVSLCGVHQVETNRNRGVTYLKFTDNSVLKDIKRWYLWGSGEPVRSIEIDSLNAHH